MATNKLTYTTIAALLATLLASCRGEDEAYGPDRAAGQHVAAQMWVALEHTTTRAATPAATRQTGSVAQADGTFRGLKRLTLIPFSLSTVPSTGETVGQDATRRADNLELGAIAPDGLYAGSGSHLYDNVSLTIGTNAFLLYAEATDDTGSDSADGAIVGSGLDGSTPDAISFRPKQICPDMTEAQTQADAMTTYLTQLAATTTATLTWADVSSGLLQGLYAELTQLTAGNSASLLAMMQSMYSRLLTASLAGEQDELRQQIVRNMKVGRKGDGWGDEQDADLSDMVFTATRDGRLFTLDWNDAYQGTTFADYPRCFSLPDGVAALQWDDQEKRFGAVATGTPNNVGNSALPLTDFVHPLPLCYRANTPISVSRSSKADRYNAADTWATIYGSYTDGHTVSRDTRSVALQHPAQYAVGRLDVLLKARAAIITDSHGLPVDMSRVALTGLIVTGQRSVDYTFTPDPDDTHTYSIYDSYDPTATDAITLATNVGKHSTDTDARLTHTLVLQTPADGQPVYIYFEFLNQTGHDISVSNGLVPDGCHFYLCGTVTPAAGEMVFEQDHVATITGTVSSLAGAYNILPPRQHAFGFDMQVAVSDWTDQGSAAPHPVYNW
ncbi:MAG: hypothetical protein K5928_00740 [Prevotella sp.]|nr:hypothetical protein [Prevotella sp.]